MGLEGDQAVPAGDTSAAAGDRLIADGLAADGLDADGLLPATSKDFAGAAGGPPPAVRAADLAPDSTSPKTTPYDFDEEYPVGDTE